MADQILVTAVCAVFVLLAVFAAWRCSDKYRAGALIAGFVAFTVSLGVIVWVWNRPEPVPSETEPPKPVADSFPFAKPTEAGYAGSNACRECHADQFKSWHGSFHRTMTQLANPETVLAPFAGVRLETEGLNASLSREGEEFWVEMLDPRWERAVFLEGGDARNEPAARRIKAKVVMTTGSHHFQAYWIVNPDGEELLQFPWRYHLAEKRWVHRKDVFLGPPEFRPGMHFRIWNSDCISCHSTGGQPGMDPETGFLTNTKVAELGISCEACHGPAEKHVAAMRKGAVGSETIGLAIVDPRELSHQRASQICGRCHSHFNHTGEHVAATGSAYRPGDELSDHGDFITPADQDEVSSRYWNDGNCRSGGREFNGMSASKCYQDGKLSCLSCHSMHKSDPDDQLAAGMTTNRACYQCHTEYENRLSEHTHHAADSAGSLCYNCHMPHTSYALFKAIRSHRVDSPRAAPIVHNGRPNACNLCHLDQTLEWTNRQLSDWFGIPPAELQDDEKEIAASVLWLLRGDAGQRAIAAWHAGWEPALEASGSGWLGPTLAQLLDDPYAAVRWLAYRSLRQLPGFEDFQYEFDAARPQRLADVERTQRLWKTHANPAAEVRAGDEAGRVLLAAPRELDHARLKQILKRRDDKPLAIVE